MERIRSILEHFFTAVPGDLAVTETFTECSITGTGQIVLPLDPNLSIKIGEIVRGGWTLSITIQGQESPHSISTQDIANLDQFLADLKAGTGLSAKASLKLYLAKKTDDYVDILDPVAFFKWLNSLEITDALGRFDELMDERSTITFINPTFTSKPATRCLKFQTVRAANPLAAEAAKNRKELFNARREQIVSDWNALKLFPDDFRWEGGRGIQEIDALFSKLENFLNVVSLADYTSLSKNDGFILRIKSHVIREEAFKWSALPSAPDIPLREVFAWCYREGAAAQLADKLSLARNYISLYWEHSVFGQDPRVVAALRAGFGMYIKRNLKEFIELRAKVASFLLELDSKASKSLETATSNFEKNIYGVVTFVTSVVLIKALQDKTFTGAFSPQVALLGWALIVFSALHAIFSWKSTDKEMLRGAELYNDLRKLYDAFFSEKDFDSIFSSNGRTPIEKTTHYVRSKLISIMVVWGTILVMAAGLIWHLRTPPTSQPDNQPPVSYVATNAPSVTNALTPKP